MKKLLARVRVCSCNCGCEPDGRWHWEERGCVCVGLRCPCVSDSLGKVPRMLRRERLMSWWWDVLGPGHVRLQNGVGRVVCWWYGHEQGRSGGCDWCGKEMAK